MPSLPPKSTLVLFLLLVVCGNLYGNFILSTKKVQEWELDLEEYRKNILLSGALTALSGAMIGLAIVSAGWFMARKKEEAEARNQAQNQAQAPEQNPEQQPEPIGREE